MVRGFRVGGCFPLEGVAFRSKVFRFRIEHSGVFGTEGFWFLDVSAWRSLFTCFNLL